MSKTFFVTNFGCRTSQSEGASIQQELLDSDATASESPYSADVVIVNSCTVTAEADRDVRQTIRRIASHNPSAKIIVTGCYAQRAPQELAKLPQVRYVIGNSHKPMVAEIASDLFDEDFRTHGRAEVLCSSIFLERELKGAMEEMKNAKHNKKILLLVTDGFDTKSHINATQVEDILKRTEVLVYAIGIDDDDEDPLVLRRTRYHIYHYMHIRTAIGYWFRSKARAQTIRRVQIDGSRSWSVHR